LVTGTEPLHLRGAEVGAIGEVEDVHGREAGGGLAGFGEG
jgi:hypothetical protein